MTPSIRRLLVLFAAMTFALLSLLVTGATDSYLDDDADQPGRARYAGEWPEQRHSNARRADVLRQLAENERFVSAKRNEAFVMMEYFGYLWRDQDDSWLSFLARQAQPV